MLPMGQPSGPEQDDQRNDSGTIPVERLMGRRIMGQRTIQMAECGHGKGGDGISPEPSSCVAVTSPASQPHPDITRIKPQRDVRVSGLVPKPTFGAECDLLLDAKVADLLRQGFDLRAGH
jgi:hypothetical protein